MPSVAEVLSRAPRHQVESLIPESVGRLQEVLNDESLSSRRRVEVALSITPPEQLLRTTEHRTRLINLLKEDEANQLLDKIDVEEDGDQYATLKSTVFYKNSNREEKFFNFFDRDVPDTTDDDAPGLTKLSPKYGLFDYQRTIFDQILDYYTSDENRVFLHMPTGSGKTRVSMSLVSKIIKEDSPGIVLWLAEGQELLEQAVEEFEYAWSYLGDREVQVSRFYGGYSWNDIDQGFIAAGLQKLWNKEKKSATFLWDLSDDVSLVVFDEAHRSVAETYQRIISRVTGIDENCRLLGLSATPGRTYADRSADRKLSELYNRNKVAIDIQGYDDPFSYLISEGYLSDPQFHTFKITSQSLTADLRREVEGMNRGQEYSQAVLKKLTEDEQRNLNIVQKILGLVEDGHTRIILFATTVEHARIVSAALNGQNVESAVITAETPEYIREREIERFKSNNDEPRVLCNYNVLTTGFDAPLTSAAVIARPTTSLVLYSQMVGRAIRGPKVGGTENADIWTVVDTELPGFGDLPEAF